VFLYKAIELPIFLEHNSNFYFSYLCQKKMSLWRVLLSVLFPPLAVIDKGCGSVLIVIILTVLGWIPGVIAALIILNNPNR
jgi:uncharacterized membrane protein YqaE (UPF0057 family)